MGKKKTPQHAENIRKAVIGNKCAAKRIKGINTDTGEIIYLYGSTSDNRFIPSSVRKCCLGVQKSHRGYTFEHIGE